MRVSECAQACGGIRKAFRVGKRSRAAISFDLGTTVPHSPLLTGSSKPPATIHQSLPPSLPPSLDPDQHVVHKGQDNQDETHADIKARSMLIPMLIPMLQPRRRRHASPPP